ncbi:MAG: class I fructose-bisphosphate aldolase [Rickettsiaceae bacterium H1]|nr:class I fructose-bisphosphate aldolase [Rickettsiaceae bacterium H1]
MLPEIIRKILGNYETDNFGSKTNLARMLTCGKLSGTGKLLILPVDQGFEHGPGKSFSINPAAYDPNYHFQLALRGKVSAYAAPLGMLEGGMGNQGTMPLILKMNSSNSLSMEEPDQAVTATVNDALRLGCVAVGFTLYPGSKNYNLMIEEAREMIKEAKYYGLAVVIWSYPRGGKLSKTAETSLDVIAYGAHMACLLGGHIIKVKLPTDNIEYDQGCYLDVDSLKKRVRVIKQACFDNRRLVVFSGGKSKDEQSILSEVKAINLGGGDGSIIGRNSFQRSKEDAISLLDKISTIYCGNV